MARLPLDPAPGRRRLPQQVTRRLVLVRHGQTAWNSVFRAQGHADISLDDTGRGQAAAAAPYLAAMQPVRLWSSDLARARETAAYVASAAGLDVEHDPRLREYDVGVRSGLTSAEFAETYPREYAAWLVHDESCLVAGEESSSRVRERILPALRECLDSLGEGETGIVVTHGACLKVGLLALLGWPHETLAAGCAAWTTAGGQCGRGRDSRRTADGLVQRDRGRSAPRPGRRGRFRVGRGRWLRFHVVARSGEQHLTWGCGAAGSAPAWHAGGQGFESPQLHHRRRWSGALFGHRRNGPRLPHHPDWSPRWRESSANSAPLPAPATSCAGARAGTPRAPGAARCTSSRRPVAAKSWPTRRAIAGFDGRIPGNVGGGDYRAGGTLGGGSRRPCTRTS